MKPLATGDPLRLGPYRLLGVLGEGGMGKVYLGGDASGTLAAVKVLRPELAHDHHLAQRFVREAHTAQAVTSPGVAQVLGAQTEGGRPWIAAQFLTGPTLDEAVDVHGPLEEATLRVMAASLARTLADIHAAGLIHRDLKPANLVLTAEGPRVIDFGIARPEHGLTLTTTGQIPVTPGYGAPEQVLGHRVTPAADIFSLGAVLAYAAAGRPAFTGGHVAAVQYEVVHGAPDLDAVPAALRDLIAPCLAKDPTHRPDPAAIATAFAPPRGADKAWRRGAVAATITERQRDTDRWSTLAGARPATAAMPRRRLLTTLAAGGVTVAAGGGATAWWWRRRTREDLFTPPDAVRTPKAKRLSEADGDFPARNKPQPLWGPRPALSKDTPAPLPIRDVLIIGARSGGIAALDVTTGAERWTAPDIDATRRYMSLSDQLVAATDDDGRLRTYVPSTGEPKWTADADVAAVLGADRHAVYVLTGDGRLRSIHRADATIGWTTNVPAAFRNKIESVPAAVTTDRLLVAGEGGDVLAVDLTTGRTAWTVRREFDGVVRPVTLANRAFLTGPTLTAHDLTDGTEIWSATGKDWEKPHQWGPPTAFADSVYATFGENPRRLDRVDGTDRWVSRDFSLNYTPLVLQGAGVWCLADRSGVDVCALDAGDGYETWYYPVPDAERRWLTADGNRVFVSNDAELTALPVF